MNEVKKFGDKLVSHEDLGLWEGDIAPILDETNEVTLHWKGGKIPATLIFECLKWFRMVNEKYSSEAQARLGYNPETGEWRWFAFPQYVNAGLYSKEISSDKLTDEQRAMRLRATKEMSEGGFIEAGTIHSHCDAGAFASGTDDHDEITQNGVHITLGRITSEKPEIHGRVVFRKIKYSIHWEDWLDGAPEGLADCWEFMAQGVESVSIDEERLMGLCFERPKPSFENYEYIRWTQGSGWSHDQLPTHYGGQSGWDWDDDEYSDWGDDYKSPVSKKDEYKDAEIEQEADSEVEDIVEDVLDELEHGYGGYVYGKAAYGEFLRKYVASAISRGTLTVKETANIVLEVMQAARSKSDDIEEVDEEDEEPAMK